ncbi:MAG: low molecular weight phosphotyrosine protein phosphatase [Lachnospiraceae bacterium]|nr:low molecular weight phosphotyrosine protein phosphatase [Lachnospiraceae bacterium]
MIRILFICHGNICRSPMAEFILKDMVKKKGVQDQFEIQSAATTTDEIWNGVGNPIYAPARKCLEKHGVEYSDQKRARLLTSADYERYDYLIGMDSENRYDMRRILGDDSEGKVSLLLDSTESPRDVADPWFTRDFEATYRDVVEGCEALLANIL